MAMFLESCLNFNYTQAFSYKHVTYAKNRALFSLKLISLFSEKLDRSNYPQRSMLLNSKAEICANSEQTKDGQSLTFL